MSLNKRLIIAGMMILAMGCISMNALADEGKVIDMPKADRATLDKFLGTGVVGKAVPAVPLGDAKDYVQFAHNATFDVKITSGELKGTLVDHRVETVDENKSGTTYKLTAGKTDILILKYTPDGNMMFLSHSEPDEGLDGHYKPPPPLLMKGMKPGTTHKTEFDIIVYYIDEPGKVKHKGHLKLNLSYLGMFEINTPTGKHHAALIKSDYEGKVGPAKLDDEQYRFFVKDVGIVAMVERKDISAFLVYQDHEKVGKLLVGEKGKAVPAKR